MAYYKGNKILSLFISFVIRVILVVIGCALRTSSGTLTMMIINDVFVVDDDDN
jgi:hypothetical protein